MCIYQSDNIPSPSKEMEASSATKTPSSKPAKKQVRFDIDNTTVHEIPRTPLKSTVLVRFMCLTIDLFAGNLRAARKTRRDKALKKLPTFGIDTEIETEEFSEELGGDLVIQHRELFTR